MPWTATLYIFFVFTASAIALALFFYAWHHRTKPGATAFAWMMLAIGQWSCSVGFMSVSETESAGQFWQSFEFIGVSFGSVLLLVFAAQYSGKARWISRKRLPLLFAIPLLSQILIWTNDLHALFFRSLRIAPGQDGLMTWSLDPGIGFWLHTVYSYLCVLGGFLLILRMIVRSFHLYRRQALALLCGLIPAIVASMTDTLGGLSGLQQELTPIGFVFMGLAFALAFFRYRLLDVVPVARERLIDNMSDGMLMLDGQDRIVDLNPAARRIFHLSLDEGIGRSAPELLYEWFPKIDVCHDGTQETLCEIVMPLDLKERHYELQISMLHDRRGQANGRLIILRDISERKMIEKMLLKLQQAVETTEVGITITDADGIIEYSNPADARLHGYPVEELLGHSSNIFADPEFRRPKKAGQNYAHIYSQWTRERTNIRKDGTSFPVKLISNPIYDDKGLLVGTVTVCEDISQRKQAEAKLLAAHKELQEKHVQLHELNASKDKFFSIISHDLRSPFNTLLGLSELLLEQFEQNSVEKNRRYIGNLHRSAERLYALLDNLLTWSRLQRGAMKHVPECVELNILVSSIFELFSPKAEQKQIELRQMLIPGIQVFADLEMLNTVLRNLVSNALKFTTTGDTVGISAGKHDDQFLEIAVTDTGSGIESEQLDKLFQPDAHYTKTGTAGEQGTGLGLILCRELVERNGGTIWVESEIGRGTTFRFTLPEGASRRRDDGAL